MDRLLDPATYQRLWTALTRWALDEVLVPGNGLQLLLILAIYFLAAPPARALRTQLERLRQRPRFRPFVAEGSPLARPGVCVVLLWITDFVLRSAGWPSQVVDIAASLLTAWVLIRFVSRVIRDKILGRAIAWLVWTVAALNILGILDAAIAALQAASIPLGKVDVSLYQIVLSTLALATLLWVALALGRLLEQRIRSSDISPSVQVLLSKSLKIVLIAVAVVVAMDSVGIDLTTLAVFSGAVGLGIGFGLQKIVGNLISGLILLLDKSIKPGDVIAVDDTYGWVNSLGGRYVSVVTRDGTEHLIPNEMLITNKVENWTHSNRRWRLRIPVGVHYKTDVRKAMELCKEAAARVERILEDPPPSCLLRGFGDNSVDLEIRVWIEDAHRGVANVQSAVLVEVWDLFLENDIEIPYPQRDLHLRSPEGLIQKLDALSDTR